MPIYSNMPEDFYPRPGDVNAPLRSNLGIGPRGPKGHSVTAEVIDTDPYGYFRIQFKDVETDEVLAITPNLDVGSRFYVCTEDYDDVSVGDAFTANVTDFSTLQASSDRSAIRVGDLVLFTATTSDETFLAVDTIAIGIVNSVTNNVVSFVTAIVMNAQVRDGGITTDMIADLAITTAKIADAAVTNGKIANNAVDTAQLNASAVTTDKIDNGAVVTTKIADEAVTNVKIGTNAITNAKIANGNVSTDKLANAAVTTDKIAQDAVTSNKIDDNAVTTQKIHSASVTTDKIATSAVTPEKLHGSTVDYLKNLTDEELAEWIALHPEYVEDVVSVVVDQQAQTYINNWLDDHPEATTTVENGSITNAKIHDDTITDLKLSHDGWLLDSTIDLGIAAGSGLAVVIPDYVIGHISNTDGSITENATRKATQFVDANTDIVINLTGIARIGQYDISNHSFISAVDRTISGDYTLSSGYAYRVSLPVAVTLTMHYRTDLSKCPDRLDNAVAYLTPAATDSASGIVRPFVEYESGHLSLVTGNVDVNASRKVSNLITVVNDGTLHFDGSVVRVCKYTGTTFVSGLDTSSTTIALEGGYNYRYSMPLDATAYVTYPSGVVVAGETNTTNLSPSDRATATATGAINTTSGNNGYFGNVEGNGRAYAFGCVALKRGASTGNIQIRYNHDGTYDTVGYIQTADIPVNTPTYLFVSFYILSDTSGYLTLNGSGFTADANQAVLTQCQLVEGAMPLPYTPYDARSAIDYYTRMTIEKWEQLHDLPKGNGIRSVAHQGYRYYGANPNTLQAYIDASRAGFDMVETDVRMTSDRVPVISHDNDRTTVENVTVSIDQTTYNDLMTYQFYADPDVKIPTLWECIETCSLTNIGIMLEIKVSDITLDEMTEIVNYARTAPVDIMFTSFNSTMMTRVRTVDEGMGVNFILTAQPSINDLKTSADYQYLRDALAQSGYTGISSSVADSTGDAAWYKDVRKLGYGIATDAANYTPTTSVIMVANMVTSNNKLVAELV